MVIETDNLIRVSTFAKKCDRCVATIQKWEKAEKVDIVWIDKCKFIDEVKYKHLINKTK